MTILRRMYLRAIDKAAEKGRLDEFVNVISDYMVAAGQDTLLIRVKFNEKLDSDIVVRHVDRIVLYEEDDDMMTSSIRKGVDMSIDQIRSARGL